MMKIDESRKRSIVIVAFTILIGASLGYIYSYSRSNRLLENKHAALKYNYNSCRGLYNKCSNSLSRCLSAGQKLQDSEKQLQLSIESEKDKLNEAQSGLEASQAKYADAYKFYSDVSVLTGFDANTVQEVTSDMVTSILEKLNGLKKDKTDYEDLKKKFAFIEEDHKRLTAEKESLLQNVQQLEASKTAMGELLAKEKALANVRNAESTKYIKPDNAKEDGVANDVTKINKIINSEKQTAEEIKNYLKNHTEEFKLSGKQPTVASTAPEQSAPAVTSTAPEQSAPAVATTQPEQSAPAVASTAPAVASTAPEQSAPAVATTQPEQSLPDTVSTVKPEERTEVA